MSLCCSVDRPPARLFGEHCLNPIEDSRAMSHFGDMGVFHLPKNSGNSGWVVTFHRKISGKKWNSGNVSPVFPVETSNGNLCSILIQISRLYHEFHAFRGSKSVFWKNFANKLSGLLRLLCLPRSSARSRKFIAARMCPI